MIKHIMDLFSFKILGGQVSQVITLSLDQNLSHLMNFIIVSRMCHRHLHHHHHLRLNPQSRIYYLSFLAFAISLGF